MTRVAYVLGTYPQLTTTFIDREVHALQSRGVEIDLVSVRRPSALLSSEQQKLQDQVTYLLPVGAGAVVRAHFRFGRRRAYWTTFLRLLTRRHPSVRARLRTIAHFAAGVHAAWVLESRACDRIHAHFVDRAAIVALTAARLLGVPYSATAHAADIYVAPVLLEEKLRRASFVATCTGYNEEHLRRTIPGLGGRQLVRIYHGIDVDRFEPPPRTITQVPVVLAVGQLKEKKGFSVLLDACHAIAVEGFPFRCVIVGDGPLRASLTRQVHELGLHDHVTLTGALPHDDVIDWYRHADIFVLPCVTGADGDRDGLPNVILEAMAMALPVVSTRTSAIAEAVDESTGRLVAPGDPRALAREMTDLLDDPAMRARLGAAGRHLVLERFDVESNVALLEKRFTQ